MTSFEEALSAVEREDWPAAETLLRALVATEPAVDPIYLMGLSLWHQGRHEESEPYFLQAHELLPEFPMACFYLAGTCRMRGDIAGAYTWLDKFIVLAPTDANGWLRLGLLLFSEARFDEAVEKLRQALTLAPESSKARRFLGHALFNCNRFTESIDTLTPFSETGQLDINSLRLLCRAAEEIGDYPRAAEFAISLNAATTHDPADRLILARTLFAAGQESAGVETYKDYLALQGVAIETRNIFGARVVTTETWEIIAARWVSLGLPSETTESGRIRPSLTRHDQALVLTPEWLVVTKDGDVLVEQMTHNPKTLRKKSSHLPALTDTRCLLDLPNETINVVEACALIGGNTNYYHWLIDHLPRIGIIRKSLDLHDLHLLVNEDLAPFQHESLAALGISTERLIPLPANAVAKCRVVWVPTLVSRLTAFHPFAANWLRRNYLKKEMKQGPRRRLFVSRLDATQRRLLNEAELIDKLRPYGFEVITPGALGFMEQIATFSTADFIVGPHGAGLTNMVFAPQQSHIFELGFPQYPSTFFYGMAGQLGQKFTRINGQAMPGESPLPHTWDFRIDIDATVNVITAALG